MQCLGHPDTTVLDTCVFRAPGLAYHKQLRATCCPCIPLQVNPLAETPEGSLLAADAKLGFDDNAGYRQKEIFAMKDDSQIDPR
jgi:hypothetical protein